MGLVIASRFIDQLEVACPRRSAGWPPGGMIGRMMPMCASRPHCAPPSLAGAEESPASFAFNLCRIGCLFSNDPHCRGA
jgi:hypothetical protein